VTGVHAEEALDALSELLNTVSFHLVEFPVHGFWTLDWLDALRNFVVPRHISNQVLDVRECFHWTDFDWLAFRRLSDNIAHSSHAHQTWASIDFSRARSALSSLAVPTNGEIRLLFVLDSVDAIEHNHTFVKFDIEGLEFGVFAFTLQNVE
jgi:hypothetical protein